MKKKVKKIVLAYSGGLDTSVILRWLQENYHAEIIAYTADLGQEINRKKIIRNATNLGVKNIVIEDLKDVFVKDYIFPMIRGNALYEGIYLLGTSIARPLIAKRQIQIAKKFKADAVSHGSTGKGNDQVRFELAYYYFNPKIKIIAPWRDWDFASRSDLIKYANKNNIPVPSDKKGAPPFSVDDNLFHTSTEGKILEDPSKQAPEFIFQRTVSPEKAPTDNKDKIKDIHDLYKDKKIVNYKTAHNAAAQLATRHKGVIKSSLKKYESITIKYRHAEPMTGRLTRPSPFTVRTGTHSRATSYIESTFSDSHLKRDEDGKKLETSPN